MKITLNKDEIEVMAKHHKINLKLLLPEDFYGHYYIKAEDDTFYIKAKKRGIVPSSNSSSKKDCCDCFHKLDCKDIGKQDVNTCSDYLKSSPS